MKLLTERQRNILSRMLEYADNDYEGVLVYERGKAYLGDDRVASRTVFHLIRLGAISKTSDSQIGRFERYTINGTGRRLLRLEQP